MSQIRKKTKMAPYTNYSHHKTDLPGPGLRTYRIIRNDPPPRKRQRSPATHSRRKTHCYNDKGTSTKTNALHNHTNNKTSLPEALAELVHIHTAIDIAYNQSVQTKLHKHCKLRQQQHLDGTWPIPGILYDVHNPCFKLQRGIHCNPIPPPLCAKTCIPHDRNDAYFGAIIYTKIAWPVTSLVLPDYTVKKMPLNKHYILPKHIDTSLLAATS